jgi:membrane associated rhomboid family serine protease
LEKKKFVLNQIITNMTFLDNLTHSFKNGNQLIKLIYINAAVFLLTNVLSIILSLFNLPPILVWTQLAVPAEINQLVFKPWTLVSYMFFHQELFHIFFNMISLFWFGKIFLMYFSEKQLVGLYVVGGLAGAAVYMVAYNVFPYFQPLIHKSVLLGASGSIMAIIVATAVKSPNMNLQLMLIGNVKLKYIALIAVGTSFFGITSENGGGQLAHLGGALAGYIFVVSLQRKTDLTAWVSWILDQVVGWFGPRKLKVKKNKHTNTSRKMSDAEYNVYKAQKMANIDKILDKIKTSGYESLSAEEKRRLFEQGNKG